MLLALASKEPFESFRSWDKDAGYGRVDIEVSLSLVPYTMIISENDSKASLKTSPEHSGLYNTEPAESSGPPPAYTPPAPRRSQPQPVASEPQDPEAAPTEPLIRHPSHEALLQARLVRKRAARRFLRAAAVAYATFHSSEALRHSLLI